MNTAKLTRNAARALVQVLFIGFFVFPIIWIFMMSLKTSATSSPTRQSFSFSDLAKLP